MSVSANRNRIALQLPFLHRARGFEISFDRLRASTYVKFFIDMPEMRPDRVVTDVHALRDFLVAQAFREQREDFGFSVGEAFGGRVAGWFFLKCLDDHPGDFARHQ